MNPNTPFRLSRDELAKLDTKPYKFKRFLRMLRWLLFVYLRQRHDATIVTRNGVLTFDSKDKTIGRILHIFRNFEFDDIINSIQYMKSTGLLDKENKGTVLDVGANIGMISTAFLLEGFFDKVIGFEPDPNNFRLLQRNIHDNGLQDKFAAYNIALSDQNQKLPFELSDNNFGDHRIRHDNHDEKGGFGEEIRQVITVDAMTLDDFLAAHKEIEQEEIKLIWMDIQGHEAKFMEGASRFFTTYPKVPVVTEFWPYGIKRSGVSKDQFCDIVCPLFKKYYSVSDRKIHDINEIGPFFANNEHPDQGTNLILFN